jgi:hypothetical protein
MRVWGDIKHKAPRLLKRLYWPFTHVQTSYLRFPSVYYGTGFSTGACSI